MSQQSTGKSVLVQGRIVWVPGDLFKGKVKIDQNTKQPKIDSKTGAQIIEYGLGLSVPKTELAPDKTGAAIWSAMHEEAYQIYPSRQIPPSFAWKYKDGDGVDHNGAPFGNREGYPGCLVFALTSQLPMKFFRYENGSYVQVNDGIKCGDYVQVQVQVKAHGAVGQGKPGLYLNPMAVLFLGYGKEIINTPSPEQMFGGQAPTLPAGASATPFAPEGAPLMPIGAPQYQAPPTPQAAVPQFQQQPAYPTQAPALPPQVQPHHAVLPQQFQPPGAPLMGNGFAPPPATAQQFASPQQGYASAPPAIPGMPPIPGMR